MIDEISSKYRRQWSTIDIDDHVVMIHPTACSMFMSVDRWSIRLYIYTSLLFVEPGLVERVKFAEDPPHRPALPNSEKEEMSQRIVDMMKSCWQEIPEQRPSFAEIKHILQSINKGR